MEDDEIEGEEENTEKPEGEDEVVIPEEGDEADEPEETVEELKARVAKETKRADDQKKRAEKAEKLNKQNKAKSGEGQDDKALSTGDLYVLMQNNVPEDDVEEVAEYAKFKGITIKEALKLNVVKSMLSDNAEARKVAEATSTGTRRRNTAQTSDEALLSNASAGNLPGSDEEIRRLAKARKGIK